MRGIFPPVWTRFLRRVQGRLALACGSGVAYVVAFLVIHARSGYEPLVLTVGPLLAGSLLFGVRGGVLAWLLVIPTNVALHMTLGLPRVLFVGEGPIRILVGLGLALLVGKLRDLTLAYDVEASERKRAEFRLRSTLDAIPDLMLRIGHDGAILDTHAGSPGNLELPPEWARSSRLGDRMPPELKARLMTTS